MTKDEIKQAISALENLIRRKQDNIDGMEARYGDGVRPAWVGEDIGMDMMDIRYARSQIEKLKAEMAQ